MKIDTDEILVRWQDDDGGWREGVLCALYVGVFYYHPKHLQRMVDRAAQYTSPDCKAVIWDRHINKPCIVSFAKISLVQTRCDVCEGTGEMMVTRNRINHDTLELVAERVSEPCSVCQGTGRE